MQKSQIIKDSKIMNDNYYFLKNIVSKKNYNINFKNLVEELKKYQKETNKTFSYRELSTIFPLLIFIYTEKLDNLCKEYLESSDIFEKKKEIYKEMYIIHFNWICYNDLYNYLFYSIRCDS